MSLIGTSLVRRELFRTLNLYKNGTIGISKQKLNRCFNTSNTLQSYSTLVRNPKFKNVMKMLSLGIGLGVFASSPYIYSIIKKDDDIAVPVSNTGKEYFLEVSPPNNIISRSIQNPADGSGLKITLYQYQTCPFCCKVRTFLDYYGFSYDVVEVNPVTRKETKWTNYKKVPSLTIEQEGEERIMLLKDSSMIISALQSFILNKKQTLEQITEAYPTIEYRLDGKKKKEITNLYSLMFGESLSKTKDELLLERKWRKWVDDVFVHLISPNVYRTLGESYDAFHAHSKIANWEDLFSSWERMLLINIGSLAMYLIAKRLKKRHNLRDDVRLSLYDETNYWLKEIKKKGGKFMGGEEPNLGDLALYGSLLSMKGCLTFRELRKNTKIDSWFLSMQELVENHHGVKYLSERGPNRQ